MHTRTQKGFTLIELLVVIAIIGILASVILASLGDARTQARIASAQSSARSVQAAAVLCQTNFDNLTAPTNVNDGGGTICAGSTSTWPDPDPGTIYTWAITDGTVDDGTDFGYTLAGDGVTITCNENGCTTS